MRRLILTGVSLLALTFALAACQSGTSSSSPAAGGGASASAAGGAGGGAACTVAAAGTTPTVSVEIKDFKFNPDPVTAKVGDTIGWTNADNVQHTATLADDSCSTETLSSGATGVLTFNAAGTYPYKCKIHSNMSGTIQVT
jgi:plastocyanin